MVMLLGEGLCTLHQQLCDQQLDALVKLLMLTFSHQTLPLNTVIPAAERAGLICGTVYTPHEGHAVRINQFP